MLRGRFFVDTVYFHGADDMLITQCKNGSFRNIDATGMGRSHYSSWVTWYSSKQNAVNENQFHVLIINVHGSFRHTACCRIEVVVCEIIVAINLYTLNAVRCPFFRNGGRGQLSSEWRHNENHVIMRTGVASAASAVGARRHNENDVTMTIAGLWRYGDWRHVATGCTALVLYGFYDRPASQMGTL